MILMSDEYRTKMFSFHEYHFSFICSFNHTIQKYIYVNMYIDIEYIQK